MKILDVAPYGHGLHLAGVKNSDVTHTDMGFSADWLPPP